MSALRPISHALAGALLMTVSAAAFAQTKGGGFIIFQGLEDAGQVIGHGALVLWRLVWRCRRRGCCAIKEARSKVAAADRFESAT